MANMGSSCGSVSSNDVSGPRGSRLVRQQYGRRLLLLLTALSRAARPYYPADEEVALNCFACLASDANPS